MIVEGPHLHYAILSFILINRPKLSITCSLTDPFKWCSLQTQLIFLNKTTKTMSTSTTCENDYAKVFAL